MGAHDKAFRRLLKEPGAAEALLRERLPRQLVRRMAGPPVLLSESFIDDSMKGSFADAVLSVPLRQADEALVYCVVEHKSVREPRALVQMLRYLAAVYAWLDRKTSRGPLPLVVPMLVYSGRRRWSGPRRFHELLDVTPALAALPLDFGVVMVDVAAEPLDALSRHPILKGGLLALRAAATPVPELEPVLDGVLHSLTDESTRTFVLRYLWKVMARDGLAVLEKSVRKHEQKGPQMQTIEQYVDARGFRRGRRTVKQEVKKAREEERRELLRSLLMSRFKRIAAKYDALLATADADTLKRWLDAALTSKSMKGVFTAR
mgnify:CR=1 FL=1